MILADLKKIKFINNYSKIYECSLYLKYNKLLKNSQNFKKIKLFYLLRTIGIN